MHARIFRTIASFAGTVVYGGNACNKNAADKNVGGRGAPRQERAEMARKTVVRIKCPVNWDGDDGAGVTKTREVLKRTLLIKRTGEGIVNTLGAFY